MADERTFKVNAERNCAALSLVFRGDQFAQAVQSFEDFFLRRCDRGRQVCCNAMFRELTLNLRQGGLISFHGISARAAVNVDIDEAGS